MSGVGALSAEHGAVRKHCTDAGRRVLVRAILKCIFGKGSVLKKEIFGRGTSVGNTGYVTASTFICHALRWGYIRLISVIVIGFFFKIFSLVQCTSQLKSLVTALNTRLSPHRVPWFLIVLAQHHRVHASILPVAGRDTSVYTDIYTHVHECPALCQRVHSPLYSFTLPFWGQE